MNDDSFYVGCPLDRGLDYQKASLTVDAFSAGATLILQDIRDNILSIFPESYMFTRGEIIAILDAAIDIVKPTSQMPKEGRKMAEPDKGQTVHYPGSGRQTFTTGTVWKDFFETRTGVNAEMDNDPNTGGKD